MSKKFVTFLIGIASAVPQVHASEPSYCSYTEFIKQEVPYTAKGLKRQHVFKFRDKTVVGLAVGESKFEAVTQLAQSLSSATRLENFCTWYHNEGHQQAEEAFSHYPVEKPTKNLEETAAHYREVLHGIFSENSLNMIDCLEKHGYIALGCNGQRHRGPTVFGMLLAYSGCSPESSADTVNRIWGLNGVPEAGRLAAIRVGHQLGLEQPESSARMRAVLSSSGRH